MRSAYAFALGDLAGVFSVATPIGELGVPVADEEAESARRW